MPLRIETRLMTKISGMQIVLRFTLTETELGRIVESGVPIAELGAASVQSGRRVRRLVHADALVEHARRHENGDLVILRRSHFGLQLGNRLGAVAAPDRLDDRIGNHTRGRECADARGHDGKSCHPETRSLHVGPSPPQSYGANMPGRVMRGNGALNAGSAPENRAVRARASRPPESWPRIATA